jgi:DNA repair protein RecO (recombination protein O)
LYSTEAIILRRADYGEADRLLTIVTPESGKARVMAKGARKITSRKAGHIELFTRVRLLLAKGRTFDIVSQAETIDAHRALREDLLRGGYAHYLGELADQFIQEGSEDVALYDLLANGLTWVCEAPNPALAARYFDMRMLTIAGYRPQLFRCARTNAPLEIDDVARAPSPRAESPRYIAFSPAGGGALCAGAATGARDALALTPAALDLMRALQTQPVESILALEPSDITQRQVERAMRLYLNYVLERSLRSTRFLSEIEKE